MRQLSVSRDISSGPQISPLLADSTAQPRTGDFMLTNYDLTAWVEHNRGKIETLRSEALHSTDRQESDRLTAKADAMEEFTNWLADLLMPLAPF